MKVYVVANLDTDYGTEIKAVHKSKVQAEITLDVLKKSAEFGYEYYKIYEFELEEWGGENENKWYAKIRKPIWKGTN